MISVTTQPQSSTAFAKSDGISSTFNHPTKMILYCFHMYYTSTLLSLGEERVILREHAPAASFYFIISGNGQSRYSSLWWFCQKLCCHTYAVLVTSEHEPAHALTPGTSFGVRQTHPRCILHCIIHHSIHCVF